jgi:carboxymethylenebutenolidase
MKPASRYFTGRARLAALLLTSAALFCFSGWAFETTSPIFRTTDALREHVRYLASAELTGRGVDTPGITLARITSGVPKLEETMKKYGKSFEYKIYAGAPHAFDNDTSPGIYREEAAKEAWGQTLDFFKKHLQG